MICQEPKGGSKACPIAFASKSLTCAQTKYPAHRLEFLALKRSVYDKFPLRLKGYTFTVWTDNNPRMYILTKPKLDTREQRWLSKCLNGAVECFNRTLGCMIRALQKWPQMLQTLTFAYNHRTTHESTVYAPFFLMHGDSQLM